MDEPREQETDQAADAVASVLLGLPEPVREFVMGPERDRVALALMQKYGLHADQGGEFERAYIQMLLGVKSPDEFRDALRAAGIPETSIAGLTTDVNEMVFKPLRQIEREMSEREPEPVSPPPPPPAPVRREVAPPVPPPPPQPAYAPPPPLGAQQQTYWVPVSITAVPQPYITTQPPVQYQVPQQPPPPVPQPPPPPVPEPPRVEVAPAPPPIPTRTWEPPPPPNLPTMEADRSPLTKDYAADPYREPI